MAPSFNRSCEMSDGTTCEAFLVHLSDTQLVMNDLINTRGVSCFY